jgi:hypothetical protein
MDASPGSKDFVPSTAVPMAFGQILDRTYRLMRNHLRLLLGIAAVPTATILVILFAVLAVMFATFGPQIAHPAATPPVLPPWLFVVFLPIYPLSILIYALYLPAAFYATTQANRGVAVSFLQAYQFAWKRFGRSLWLMVLAFLYLVAPVLVILALIGGVAALIGHGAGTGSGPAYAFFLMPLLILLYLGMLVYSVFIMLRFALAYPALIEEDITAWSALQRSARLTHGAKGRIFLVMLVIYAIVYAIELVCILVLVAIAALGAFVALAAHVTAGSPAFFILIGVGVLAYLVVIGLTILLSYAAFTTALAVLYHDQRLREHLLSVTAPLASPESGTTEPLNPGASGNI